MDGNDGVCNSLYHDDKIMGDRMKVCLGPPGLPNIYSPSLRPSPFPLFLHRPTVAQCSAKLSSGGGEKQIVLQHQPVDLS